MPTVSVIVPCFNQASFLEEAVRSVAAQTFQDWECLIVNDGSTDTTGLVAGALAAQYSERVRVLTKPNGGLADARNHGIARSRGRYILPLDADDRVHPQMLEKLVRVLDDTAEAAIAFSDTQHFGERDDVFNTGPCTLGALLNENTLAATALYRRTLFDALGGYNAGLRAYEDWDFWLRAARGGWKGEKVSEPLFFYRRLGTGMLAASSRERKRHLAALALLHQDLYDVHTIKRAHEILAGEGGGEGGQGARRALCFWPHDADAGFVRATARILAELSEGGWELCHIAEAGFAQEVPSGPLLKIGDLAPSDAMDRTINFLRDRQPLVAFILDSGLGYLLAPLITVNAPECRVANLRYPCLMRGRPSVFNGDLEQALGEWVDFDLDPDAVGGTEGALRMAQDSLARLPKSRRFDTRDYTKNILERWSSPGGDEPAREVPLFSAGLFEAFGSGAPGKASVHACPVLILKENHCYVTLGEATVPCVLSSRAKRSDPNSTTGLTIRSGAVNAVIASEAKRSHSNHRAYNPIRGGGRCDCFPPSLRYGETSGRCAPRKDRYGATPSFLREPG